MPNVSSGKRKNPPRRRVNPIHKFSIILQGGDLRPRPASGIFQYFSLITVNLSSLLIDWIQEYRSREETGIEKCYATEAVDTGRAGRL